MFCSNTAMYMCTLPCIGLFLSCSLIVGSVGRTTTFFSNICITVSQVKVPFLIFILHCVFGKITAYLDHIRRLSEPQNTKWYYIIKFAIIFSKPPSRNVEKCCNFSTFLKGGLLKIDYILSFCNLRLRKSLDVIQICCNFAKNTVKYENEKRNFYLRHC